MCIALLNCTTAPERLASVMKPVAKLDVDFSRIVVVKSSERQAVVNQQVAIGDVERVQRNGKSLAEVLSEREINLRVAGQVSAGMLRIGRTIREARAVVDIRRNVTLPRKLRVEADVERIALVMIERGIARRNLAGCGICGIEADEAAGDRSRALSDLIRVGEMNVRAIPESRRTNRRLPVPRMRAAAIVTGLKTSDSPILL